MKRSYLIAGAAILVIVAVALIIIIVGRCDPGEDISCVDPSDQVITYWYQHRETREATLQALVQEFNETNEWGITVQAVHAGSYGEIYNKIVEAITSGRELPALSVAYQNQAATYALMDSVVELTPYLEDPKWGFTEEDRADFFRFVDLGDYLPHHDGRFGFPPQRSMEVLYYNEDWLAELGYDGPPRTWEAFREMACAASDPDAGTYGYGMSYDPSTFADMVFNRGGQMLTEDAREYAFGGQPGLDVLTFLQQLFVDSCAVMETETYGDQEMFGQGQALFIIGSTSGLPNVKEKMDKGAGQRWSISTLPSTLAAPKVDVYGASLSVMRTTPEKQLAAWLFLKWLTDTEQTALWSREINYFPVRKSAAAELADYLAENPQFARAMGFLDYDLAIEPAVVGYDECRNEIAELMEKVVLGADPAMSLAETVESCNRFIPRLEDS